MNRTRRRAAVISWAITAGVLYGGVGLGLVAVPSAAADPGATDPTGGRTDGTGARAAGNAAGDSPRVGRQALGVAADDGPHHRRYPGRGAGRVLPGGVPAEGAEPAEWPWPCHIVWPVWPVAPVSAAVPPRNSIISGVAPVGPPVAPLAVLSGAIDPVPLELRIARRLGRISDIANSGLPQPAEAEPPRFSRSMTPAVVVPLAGPGTPPAAPAPPRPESGGGSPVAGRTGYPEYLRDADVADVAVVALPGVAGILGITALGGFLGYRQAKVGFILRAAGSARFLQ